MTRSGSTNRSPNATIVERSSNSLRTGILPADSILARSSGEAGRGRALTSDFSSVGGVVTGTSGTDWFSNGECSYVSDKIGFLLALNWSL
ncbi:hypothetical protein IAD21_05004 [Abditibacteriota bacterium]|nr:hypothetical protein IAD21_05004 [Abditibacteriota bacterium]